MTMHAFNLGIVHSSWHDCIHRGLSAMNAEYLNHLANSSDWLPGPEKIFSAFSLPVDKVQNVLFGESPYPRRESANGYAFWDAAVEHLWSPTGLNKKVNRATSLRNMMKMLLLAENKLRSAHMTQNEIANIDKSIFVTTNQAFFNNFLQHGFLLLNAALVLQPHQVPHKDAKAWRPFLQIVLNFLLQQRPNVQFILFGRIAGEIDPLIADKHAKKLVAEHPYNLSFITNPTVLSFFKQFQLLRKST